VTETTEHATHEWNIGRRSLIYGARTLV